MKDSPIILVVEDDPQLQIIIEESLSGGGFGCVITASGEEANNRLQEGAGKYQALLTDINLSGAVDGWEVAKRAREMNPDMPVIYMTGDSAGQWASSGVPHSIILNKPFAPAQIVTAVAQLLNTGTPSNPP